MPKKRYYHIGSKNAVLELLRDGFEFEKILLANNAYKDPKTKDILKLARKQKIPVVRVSRRVLNRRNKNGGTESIVGLLEAPNVFSIEEVLEAIYEEGLDPFVLVLDHIKYSQNLGAIFRTAYASGVNCIVLPNREFGYINDEVIRISMGTCLRIPVVQLSIINAISILKKHGIRTVGVSMEGKPYYTSDLSGAVGIVMGAEDTGISPKVLENMDEVVSIPMREGIGSLNVSVSTGVILFDRMRQIQS